MNFPGFIGPSATSFAQKAAIQRTINMYLEPLPDGENENSVALIKSPGMSLFSQLQANGRTRGMYELNDHAFIVIDQTIYDVGSNGNVIASYGPIASDDAPVQIAADPTTLFVTSAGILYRVSGSLTTPVLPCTPRGIVSLKNYAIVLADNLRQFFFSDDGVTWDAADVQTAEVDANAMLAMAEHQQELWICGNRISQVFAVGTDFEKPFVPRDEGVISEGILAPASLQASGTSLLWLAQNKKGSGHVIRVDGYRSQRVSTPAVENAIRGYSRKDDAIGWTYEMNGLSFYRLTFPTQNVTWEYNVTLNHWTEIGWWNQATGLYEAHRGFGAISAFGKILIGDRANGGVYQMSPDFYDDAGLPLRWLRRAPHLVEGHKRVDYRRFEIAGEKGVGLDVAVGAVGYDPKVSLRWSDDGGRNWSNFYARSLGKNGEFSKRTYWGPLGIARDRVWEISGSDPVKTVFTAAYFDADVLAF